MNDDELKALVARVTTEVASEIRNAGVNRGMGVSDLSAYAKDFGGGKLPSAWKISYDTSSGFSPAGDIGDVAWKISYDTSGKALLPEEKVAK